MYNDLIDRLAQTPARFEAIVEGLPPEAWTQAEPDPQTGEVWTLAHVARHLRDIELDSFQFRIRQILSQSDPQFERRFTGHINPDRSTDGPTALAEFTRARAETVARLWRLTAAEWAMTTKHPRRDPLDITYFARAFLDHDEEHLRQAQRIVEGLVFDHQ
ncbi:MAG: DinB family protein [Ardenticatenaceae bacterium]|nr:DinB family protein [Ardenticatenaceae bacterium]